MTTLTTIGAKLLSVVSLSDLLIVKNAIDLFV